MHSITATVLAETPVIVYVFLAYFPSVDGRLAATEEAAKKTMRSAEYLNQLLFAFIEKLTESRIIDTNRKQKRSLGLDSL
jgi:hypothetical protein